MKTIKLIVLCLSLFLVSHSTFAQLSEKQIKYNKTLTEYNDSIQKHKERVQILNDIDKRIESSTLSEAKKNDLKAQRDIRYKKIKTLEQNIQKLDNTLKTLERQIQIEENAKRLLQEQMQMTKEELDAEKQKILDLTRRYWAKKIDWHTYVDLIFGNRSQISFNGKKYTVEIWDYEIYNKNRAIDHNNSEMKIIRDNFCNDVYKMTGNVFKPDIDREDLVVSPDAPSHFSTWVNGNVKKLTGKPLPPATKKEIQKQFNSAAAQQATLESQNEKIAAEVKKLTESLETLQELCPGC